MNEPQKPVRGFLGTRDPRPFGTGTGPRGEHGAPCRPSRLQVLAGVCSPSGPAGSLVPEQGGILGQASWSY